MALDSEINEGAKMTVPREGPSAYGKVLVVVFIFAGAGVGVLVSQYMPIFGGLLEKNLAQPWSPARMGLIGQHVLALSVAGAALGFLLVWLRGSASATVARQESPSRDVPERSEPVEMRTPAAESPKGDAERPVPSPAGGTGKSRMFGLAVAAIVVVAALVGYLVLHGMQGSSALKICKRLETTSLVQRCRSGDAGAAVFDPPDEYAALVSKPGSVYAYDGEETYRSHAPPQLEVLNAKGQITYDDSHGVGNEAVFAVLNFPVAHLAIDTSASSLQAAADMLLASREKYEGYTGRLRSAFVTLKSTPSDIVAPTTPTASGETPRASTPVASAPPSPVVPPATSVALAGARYAAQDCGSILDSTTSLEWYVGPDKDTPWDDAVSWATSLTTCGAGWRMPNIDELKMLYDAQHTAGTGYFRDGQHFPAKLDPAFAAIGGGSWVWSTSAPSGTQAVAYNFFTNGPAPMAKDGSAPGNLPGFTTRAFAVRGMAARATSDAPTNCVACMTQEDFDAAGRKHTKCCPVTACTQDSDCSSGRVCCRIPDGQLCADATRCTAVNRVSSLRH